MYNKELEEEKLDEYVEGLIKTDIEIPPELEDRIIQRIKTTPVRNKNTIKISVNKMLAAAVILVMLFTASVKWIPSFGVYASNIPVLKIAVEWIRGDSGTEYARRHGYESIEGIVVEKDGYILTFDDIIFDEDRLVFSVIAGGDKIEELLEDLVDEDERKKNDSLPTISIEFLDFEEGGSSQIDFNRKEIRVKAEKTFKAGEAAAFLERNPQYIQLSGEIFVRFPFEHNILIEEFKDIKIPFDKEKVLLSKKYMLMEEIEVPYGIVKMKELTISPTRMKLDVGFDLEDDYLFSGFESLYLMDSKGNAYQSEGLISMMHHGDENFSFFFVPSIYFEDKHEELYVAFDGIWIGSIKDNSITVNLTDTYPKTINYMGEDIIIEGANHSNTNGKGTLTVDLLMPQNIKVSGLKVEGHEGSFYRLFRDTNYLNGKPYDNQYGLNALDYSEEYNVILINAGRLHNISKQLKLLLK
ncbi:DUF4179 domain-containing protein [Alkaliphilus peptidifermentans]|uniref:DUF4179 domain-containing protein n=1 Tax=Alkaliphilus peptidifermentans DSM 18978 TaxID=1120976 RepID=A0A1G5KA71_9FIRM|nr:DUF4179 domain-containing protein [Alkaliphilus peptidifermentans]SCY97161.1 protein of unknown function [Alkaliphilus peptidifermentans DSM 18978]